MDIKKITILIWAFGTFVSNSMTAEKIKKMPVADQPSVKLWNKCIKDRPDKILDGWGLIDGLILCKQAGKLNNHLANFATTAFAGGYRNNITDCVLTEKKFIIYAQNLKGTALTEPEEKKVKALYESAKKQYGDRSGAMKYGTFGMGKALLLGLTVNNNSWLKSIESKFGIGDRKINEDKNWIKRAVDRIGKYHGWYATVEEGKNIPFEKYKESIDKRIPIIIEKNEYYKLIVGYIDSGNEKYVILVDLAKTPLESKGMIYLPNEIEYFESLPPDNSRRKAYEYKKNKKMFTADLQIRSKMPLPIGITIEEFKQDKYHAYFVHSWHKSMDAWKPEIEKIVKN